ncbi:MAG: ATP-binding cassette domain-containing protein [Oscillospiraceae bacterium]|nr:ATP-binding cassette domain-containing protein [Oscillospiraceae bacterium]
MSIYDEQIRFRKASDQADFEDALYGIADAVMGKNVSEALNDDRIVTTDAIGDVLKFYHLKAREIPEEIQDMNEVLEFLLRPHGMMRRRVVLDDDWYRRTTGALLATRTDDGSVVALIPIGVGHYRFKDHKTGKMVVIKKKNRDLISHDAIMFYKPFPQKELTVGSLIKYIVEQIDIDDLIVLILAMLAVTSAGMMIPWINNRLFSDVLVSSSMRMLLGAGIFLVCATLSGVLLGSVKALLATRISMRLSVNVFSATMIRILTLPASFFRNYSAGELSSRAGYMTTLCDQMVDAVLSTGLSALLSLAYVTQLSAYAPSLTVPALTVTLLTVVVSVITVFVQTKVTRQQMLLGSKESGMSYAVISGIQKIRITGSEKRAFSRWGKLFAKRANLLYNPPFFLKISSVITLAISLIGTLIMYAIAIRNGVSVAEYYSFNAAYGAVSSAFMALSGIAATIANFSPILNMVKPIMETVPELTEDKLSLTHVSGGIELNNVSFRYEDSQPPILDDLNLKIQAGQYVAVVGKTGCGKSTLMRIMLGFETPQRGSVYYDGHDLQSLDLHCLRRQIGSVMQNGKLFSGDIYSNIVVAAPWLTMKEAWEAAEIAGIADDIRRMPMQMHTWISEGQGGISGGQKQRLMIARAIAPKPRILFFDEATSALDNVTQKKISEAMDTMKCTRIVIAHRLSTIRQCDRILVLDHGKIVEDGNYEDLIARNGFFAELVDRQRLDEEE